MGTVVQMSEARARRGLASAGDPARAAAAVAAGKRLLKQDELADVLGVTRWTIRNYRRAGMPAHPIGGTGYRYILADVLAWQAQREVVADGPRQSA